MWMACNRPRLFSVDTPGYIEFHGESSLPLGACDGSCWLVLSATSGRNRIQFAPDYAVNYRCHAWHLSSNGCGWCRWYHWKRMWKFIWQSALAPLQIPIGEGASNFEGVVVTYQNDHFGLPGRPTNRDRCTSSPYRKGSRNSGNDR